METPFEAKERERKLLTLVVFLGITYYMLSYSTETAAHRHKVKPAVRGIWQAHRLNWALVISMGLFQYHTNQLEKWEVTTFIPSSLLLIHITSMCQLVSCKCLKFSPYTLCSGILCFGGSGFVFVFHIKAIKYWTLSTVSPQTAFICFLYVVLKKTKNKTKKTWNIWGNEL